MERRKFIASSIAATCVAGSASVTGLAEDNGIKPEYYELRLYHMRRGPKTRMMDDFFREVAIPAMNRAGIGPVGAFNVSIGPDSPTLYILIPHKSLESFSTASARVEADSEYQKAGAGFINLPAADPAYVRMESSLMRAFDSIPKLEVPEKKPRIFQLRTYESHNRKASKKKIEMFNTGEIALFRRAGIKPVFFGETIIGPKMPNLTYMVTFDNMAAGDKAWGAFGSDPEWRKMSTAPGFTDPEIVSNITNYYLSPTGYSQI